MLYIKVTPDVMHGISKARTSLVVTSGPEHSSWSLETKEQAEWVGTS